MTDRLCASIDYVVYIGLLTGYMSQASVYVGTSVGSWRLSQNGKNSMSAQETFKPWLVNPNPRWEVVVPLPKLHRSTLVMPR